MTKRNYFVQMADMVVAYRECFDVLEVPAVLITEMWALYSLEHPCTEVKAHQSGRYDNLDVLLYLRDCVTLARTGQKYVELQQSHERQENTGALKFDTDKPRYTLLDQVFIWGIVKVLEFGAKKYAVNNWRKGFMYSRLLDASHRHLAAFARGERLDPETGLPHLDHLGCCLMFLRRFDATAEELPDGATVYTGLDDRRFTYDPESPK